MTDYSERTLDHLRRPRRIGRMREADGEGRAENPLCGDIVTFYIRVRAGVIRDVSFQAFGCAVAIAAASKTAEMAADRRVEEALCITGDLVRRELGGIPGWKRRCVSLGAEALSGAVADHLSRRKDERSCVPEGVEA